MINFLVGGRKALFSVLMWDSSRKQWESLQLQEERKRRALAESILHVRGATEVEVEPVAG